MSDHRFISGAKLSQFSTAFTGSLTQEQADAEREKLSQELAHHQDMLFAREEHGVVMLFQGMDGAGKDGALKMVAAMLDPQGCHAHSLQKPSERDHLHDYMRRYIEKLPLRGQICMFNRSYYESVIPQQVHPERLQDEKLPEDILKSEDLFRQRYRQINDFERYLSENGYLILKFFLHLSRDKQRERFLERLKEPEKHWKFSPTDMVDRRHWDRHQEVFQEVLTETSTKYGQWFVIPADHRWYTGYAIVKTLLDTLKNLKLSYPQPDQETKQQMDEAKKELQAERR